MTPAGRDTPPRIPEPSGRVRRELLAAGITDPKQQQSYQRARTLNARHGKTYYLATLLLPRAKRPYVHALYGFARHADDIVDDTEVDLNPDERARRFEQWSRRCLQDLDDARTDEPFMHAILDTTARWQIPTSYFRDFLASMAMDLTISEYATYADLTTYMWGSAAVIGLQMLPVLGYADDEPETAQAARSHAIDLGLAFQLTNFLRDINEDLARGRIYLPQDSLQACGVDRARLLHARTTHATDRPIRDLIALETDRARRLYRTAAAGIALVHPTSRDCLRTAFTLYSDILTEIGRNNYDVFKRRTTVGNSRRIGVAAVGILRARHAGRSTASDRMRAARIGLRAVPRQR